MRISELLDWLGNAMFLYEENALSDAPLDPKRVDLLKEYGKLNKKLFGDKLGVYPMKWNRRKGAGALVKWSWEGGRVQRRYGRERGDRKRRVEGAKVFINSVEVSTYYQSTIIGFYSRLAHEMIHVFLLEQGIDDGHGRLFKQEMRRINAMNLGFDIKISENATDFTPDIVAKTGKGQRRGVLILDDRSIIVFGQKHFVNTFYGMFAYRPGFLENHNFEWYWSDAPGLMKYPAARKIGRGFGTYKAEPELLKEIRRGQKIAEIEKGQPRTLMPKYFDASLVDDVKAIYRKNFVKSQGGR